MKLAAVQPHAPAFLRSRVCCHAARKPPQNAFPQPVTSTTTVSSAAGTIHDSPFAPFFKREPSAPQRRVINGAPASSNRSASSCRLPEPTIVSASDSLGENMSQADTSARTSCAVAGRSALVYVSTDNRPAVQGNTRVRHLKVVGAFILPALGVTACLQSVAPACRQQCHLNVQLHLTVVAVSYFPQPVQQLQRRVQWVHSNVVVHRSAVLCRQPVQLRAQLRIQAIAFGHPPYLQQQCSMM